MLLKSFLPAASAAALFGIVTLPAHAITLSGAVKQVSPMSDVTWKASPDITNIRLFPEQQNVTLASPLAVDMKTAGTADEMPVKPSLLPAGTQVNSFFLCSDVAALSIKDVTYTGIVTFDTPILGIVFGSASLTASDSALGLSKTKYLSDSPLGMAANLVRGLEFNGTEKVKWVDAKTIAVTFDTTWAATDQMRVLTAAPIARADVPEPGSIALLIGMGTAGLGLLRRRRSA